MSAASPAGPSPARAYPAQAYPAWTPGTQVHTTQRVPLQRPPPHRANAAERLLHDHVGRLVRSPGRWVGLILHLSRLPPPGPRPHHRRVAQALLHDSARRHDGQVYALRNGDLVLLTPSHAEPPALAELLHRLLHVAAEQDHPLVSVWPMADTQDQFAAYTAARLNEHTALPPDTPTNQTGPNHTSPNQTGTTDALGALVDTLPITAALHRQTAVLLAPAGHARLRPLFREITFSTAVLEARLGLHHTAADPFLFRHLAARLDRRLLHALGHAAGRHGPLDPAATPRAHLNLTLEGILSDDFPRFAAACHAAGARPGIEVAFVEACADPAAFARAQARLAAAGMPLVLDGVAHLALLLAHPGRLAPGLLKLDWSPHLTRLPAADAAAIDAAIAETRPGRIVLQRADSEAALHWGRARGISRFQGRHVDAMLAAARITTCPAAEACSLRQCLERGSAGGTSGRAGCRNPSLLDAAL